MMKRLSIIFFLLCASVIVQAQNVSNVAFYQEGKDVIVTYSLDKTADIALQVSTDGGKTFSAPLQYVSGDVGKNTKAGANRIIWNVLAEREQLEGKNIVFQVSAVSQYSSLGVHNGHEYVDLGLPSGTLWATCNIGANRPEDYGYYYEWGETTHYKSKYDKNKYVIKTGSGTLLKYNTQPKYGTIDNKTTLTLTDDAAHVNWGGNWRMPTKEDVMELLSNCKWTKKRKDGHKGYLVIGPNGNSIFFPAECISDGSKFSYAYYWTSSLRSEHSWFSYILEFNKYDSEEYKLGSTSRGIGCYVRAVVKP